MCNRSGFKYYLKSIIYLELIWSRLPWIPNGWVFSFATILSQATPFKTKYLNFEIISNSIYTRVRCERLKPNSTSMSYTFTVKNPSDTQWSFNGQRCTTFAYLDTPNNALHWRLYILWINISTDSKCLIFSHDHY